MNNSIVYTVNGDDVPVKIETLTPDAIAQGFTPQDLIGRVRPDATGVREIADVDKPKDKLFRNAWDDSNEGTTIGINGVKAVAIAHELRRADRDAKLSPLDKEKAFASTTTSRKTAINAEHLAIRDANAIVQTDIDATLVDGVVDEAALREVLTAAAVV